LLSAAAPFIIHGQPHAIVSESQQEDPPKKALKINQNKTEGKAQTPCA
jgi:hypothetical protein